MLFPFHWNSISSIRHLVGGNLQHPCREGKIIKTKQEHYPLFLFFQELLICNYNEIDVSML